MIKNHMAKLGFKARDRVTGFQGVVTTVSFDLYGCVQVILNPGLDKDGKPQDLGWYDIKRLEILSEAPVMEVPDFAKPEIGASEKPAFSQR